MSDDLQEELVKILGESETRARQDCRTEVASRLARLRVRVQAAAIREPLSPAEHAFVAIWRLVYPGDIPPIPGTDEQADRILDVLRALEREVQPTLERTQ